MMDQTLSMVLGHVESWVAVVDEHMVLIAASTSFRMLGQGAIEGQPLSNLLSTASEVLRDAAAGNVPLTISLEGESATVHFEAIPGTTRKVCWLAPGPAHRPERTREALEAAAAVTFRQLLSGAYGALSEDAREIVALAMRSISDAPASPIPVPFAEVRAHLEALRARYVATLPGRFALLRQAVATPALAPAPALLLAHRLHGSAGSYGCKPVGEAAAALERALDKGADPAEIDGALRGLGVAVDQAVAGATELGGEAQGLRTSSQ